MTEFKMSQYNKGPHGPFNQQFYNKMNQFSQSNNSMSSNQYDDYNHGYNPSQPKQQFNQQQQHQSDMMKYHNPNLYNQQYNQTTSNSSYQSYTNSSNKQYVHNPQLSQPNNQSYSNLSNSSITHNNNIHNNNHGYSNNKGYDDQEYKQQIIPSYKTHPNQNQNQNQNQHESYQQPDHTSHRAYNQYHPKQNEQFVETKKAHIYNMRAHLENGILSVEVYDAIQRNQWRAEFTQNNFQNLALYTVAKVLVDAINTLTPGKNKISIDGFKPVAIQEYNGLCYLTVNGAQIPQTTFALYPYNTI